MIACRSLLLPTAYIVLLITSHDNFVNQEACVLLDSCELIEENAEIESEFAENEKLYLLCW